MRMFLIVLSISSQLATFSQDFNAIRMQLEEVNDLDQKYRIILDSLMRKRKLEWLSPEIQNLLPVAAKQDSINMVTMLDLIDKHGWLGTNKVGKKANQTLFLIIQHADTNILLKYFPLLVKSYELGETPARFYATMLDRILVERGQKQLYGTQIQMKNENGELLLFPIDNEAQVDARRRKVGLMPLKVFKQSLKS